MGPKFLAPVPGATSTARCPVMVVVVVSDAPFLRGWRCEKGKREWRRRRRRRRRMREPKGKKGSVSLLQAASHRTAREEEEERREKMMNFNAV